MSAVDMKLVRYIIARNEMNAILCRCRISRIIEKDGNVWFPLAFVG